MPWRNWIASPTTKVRQIINYVWSAGDPLRHLLVLPRTVIKVNGILQQPTPGTDPLGMKVWVIPPRNSHSS